MSACLDDITMSCAILVPSLYEMRYEFDGSDLSFASSGLQSL